MKTGTIMEFLANLEQNNSMEWMKKNKNSYLEAKAIFADLIQELLLRSSWFDSTIPNLSANDLTFKLNRDTRFSKDKSPYRPAFRAHIAPKGKIPIPVGYYVYIAPNNRSFLGGGLFASMFKDATAVVRDYITEHGEEFEEVVASTEFSKLFTVKGEALSNVPTGYDANHPQAIYLKNKSWYLEYSVSDNLVLDSDMFVCEAVNIFAQMRPFNDLLNRALQDFKMPER